MSDLERFLSKVARQTTPCWLWRGGITGAGYGTFKVSGKHASAHRWLFEQLREAVPEGMHLDHLCRNRECVNPEHLEPVTPKVNTARGRKGPRDECSHGHPYTPENTYHVKADGSRMCRTCGREAQARYRAAKAAKSIHPEDEDLR